MAQKLIEFECRAMPGLTLVAGGIKYRFGGGKLRVESSAAEGIREYAAKRPHLGIREVGAVEPEVVTPADLPEGGPHVLAEPSMEMTKSQLVDLAVTRGMNREAVASLTKAEIIEALG